MGLPKEIAGQDVDTRYIEDRVFDKSDWPEGPWTEEPDRVWWLNGEHICLVQRNPVTGNLNGYVGVPDTNPAARYHYSVANTLTSISVTYSEDHIGTFQSFTSVLDPRNADFLPIKVPGVWWFGFYTDGIHQLMPAMSRLDKLLKERMGVDAGLTYLLGKRYPDINEVRGMVLRLSNDLMMTTELPERAREIIKEERSGDTE